MPYPPYSRQFVTLLSCLFCVSAGVAAEPLDVGWDALRDVETKPLSVAEAKWKVVCFLGAECPLARLYGPRLRQFAEEFSAAGVQVLGINSNPQDSPADIKRYIREHNIPFPIVKDQQQVLARQFGVTRTPEVYVLDASGHVRYRGRIDNQYEPGTARPKPTRHELRDALEALIAGREVSKARTTAVGCLITMVKPPRLPTDPAAVVTFTRDVAPILNQHCVECHREGEIGPFALTDYEEVVGWGEMILEVIAQHRMPPWHADPKHGKFVGERRLPNEARETLAAWVEQGMSPGDPQDLPPQPKWVGGWHLSSEPDVELAMRDRPFIVPPDGNCRVSVLRRRSQVGGRPLDPRGSSHTGRMRPSFITRSSLSARRMVLLRKGLGGSEPMCPDNVLPLYRRDTHAAFRPAPSWSSRCTIRRMANQPKMLRESACGATIRPMSRTK